MKASDGYYLYDLFYQKKTGRITCPMGIKWASPFFEITPDNKYIIDFAEFFPSSKLMIIEIETGDYKLYDFGNVRNSDVFFVEHESKYYISAVNDNLQTDFYYFIYPFDDMLEIFKFASISDCYTVIDYKNGKFASADHNGKLIIYDAEKNNSYTIHYDSEGVLYSIKWSQSMKYVVLAESEKIYIIDVDSKKVIWSHDTNYGCFADFYDNDTKLLIGSWQKGCCLEISDILNRLTN